MTIMMETEMRGIIQSLTDFSEEGRNKGDMVVSRMADWDNNSAMRGRDKSAEEINLGAQEANLVSDRLLRKWHPERKDEVNTYQCGLYVGRRALCLQRMAESTEAAKILCKETKRDQHIECGPPQNTGSWKKRNPERTQKRTKKYIDGVTKTNERRLKKTEVVRKARAYRKS